MSKKKTASTKKPTEPKTHEDYFELTREYKKKYGEQVLLLMQVGAFFEIYGLKNESGEITGSNLVEIAELCQLNISDKKMIYENQNLMMAGFRDYTIDKYISKLKSRLRRWKINLKNSLELYHLFYILFM